VYKLFFAGAQEVLWRWSVPRQSEQSPVFAKYLNFSEDHHAFVVGDTFVWGRWAWRLRVSMEPCFGVVASYDQNDMRSAPHDLSQPVAAVVPDLADRCRAGIVAAVLAVDYHGSVGGSAGSARPQGGAALVGPFLGILLC